MHLGWDRVARVGPGVRDIDIIEVFSDGSGSGGGDGDGAVCTLP